MLKSLRSSVLSEEGSPEPADQLLAAAWLEGDLWRDALRHRRKHAAWAVGILGVGVPAGVILVLNGILIYGLTSIFLSLFLAGYLFIQMRGIEPNRRVASVTTVHWSGVAFPLDEESCVLYDLSGTRPGEKIRLEVLEDETSLDELSRSMEAFDQPLNAFEPSDRRATVDDSVLYGIDAGLGRFLEQVTEALEETETFEVEIPTVGTEDPVVPALQELHDSLEPENFGPVVTDSDPESLVEAHRMLLGIRSMSRDGEYETTDELLSNLEDSIEGLQQQLESTHRESLQLIDKIHTLATHTTAWPSQRVFCPVCNEPSEEGEFDTLARSTSLYLALDADSELLRCPVCESGLPEEEAVSVSRLKQEVLNPVFDQVFLSLRNEVLRIDREIENKLMDVEKEQNVTREDALRQAEQARRQRLAKLREMRSQATSLETRVRSIADKLTEYERLEAARQREFRGECREIRKRVERKIEEVEERIEREFAIDDRRANLESAEIARINRIERERRHQEQLEASAQIQEQLERNRRELKRQTKVQMMTGKERQAVRREGPLDRLNPVKQYRRKKALRSAREHRENLEENSQSRE